MDRFTWVYLYEESFTFQSLNWKTPLDVVHHGRFERVGTPFCSHKDWREQKSHEMIGNEKTIIQIQGTKGIFFPIHERLILWENVFVNIPEDGSYMG